MNQKQYDFIATKRLRDRITDEKLIPVMKDGKWGLINYLGRCTFACNHDSIPEQITGVTIKLKRNGKYGVRNFDGDVIIEYAYKSIEAVERNEFYNSADKDLYYIVQTENGKFGVLNSKGDEIIPCDYEKISYQKNSELYKVVRNGKEGLKDLNGKTCMPTSYYNIRRIHGDIYVVQNSHGYEGLYDIERKKVLCSPKYKRIEAFETTCFAPPFALVALVRNEKGLWGLIDIDGNEFIKCKYSAVKSFSYGYAAVQNEEDKWGYIDIFGNNITGFVYTSANPVGSMKFASVEYLDPDSGEIIEGRKYF